MGLGSLDKLRLEPPTPSPKPYTHQEKGLRLFCDVSGRHVANAKTRLSQVHHYYCYDDNLKILIIVANEIE